MGENFREPDLDIELAVDEVFGWPRSGSSDDPGGDKSGDREPRIEPSGNDFDQAAMPLPTGES